MERPRPLLTKIHPHRGTSQRSNSSQQSRDELSILTNNVRFGHEVAGRLAADIALFRKNGGPRALPHPDTYFAGIEGGGPFQNEGRPSSSFAHTNVASGYRYVKDISAISGRDNVSVVGDATDVSISNGVPYGASASVRQSLRTVGGGVAHVSLGQPGSSFDLISPTGVASAHTAGGTGKDQQTVTKPSARSGSSSSSQFRYPVLSDRPALDEELMIQNINAQEALYYSLLLPAMMGVEVRHPSQHKAKGRDALTAEDFVTVSPLTPAAVGAWERMSGTYSSVPSPLVGATLPPASVAMANDDETRAASSGPSSPRSPIQKDSGYRPHHHNPERHLHHLLPNVPPHLLAGPNGVLFLPSPVPLRTSLYEVPISTLGITAQTSPSRTRGQDVSSASTAFSVHHQRAMSNPTRRAASSSPLAPTSANAIIATSVRSGRTPSASSAMKHTGNSIHHNQQANYYADPNAMAQPSFIESDLSMPFEVLGVRAPPSQHHTMDWNASTFVGSSGQSAVAGASSRRQAQDTAANDKRSAHSAGALMSPSRDEQPAVQAAHSPPNRHYVDLASSRSLQRSRSSRASNSSKNKSRFVMSEEGRAHLRALQLKQGANLNVSEDFNQRGSPKPTARIHFDTDESLARYYLQAMNLGPLIDVAIPYAASSSNAPSTKEMISSPDRNPMHVDGNPIANGHVAWELLRVVFFTLEDLDSEAGGGSLQNLPSLEAAFRPSYRELWANLAKEGSLTGGNTSVGSTTPKTPILSVSQRQQLVLAHITNAAIALGSILTRGRRVSSLLKQCCSPYSMKIAPSSDHSEKQSDSPYGAMLSSMWAILAEILSTFFIIKGKGDPSLTGDYICGIHRVDDVPNVGDHSQPTANTSQARINNKQSSVRQSPNTQYDSASVASLEAAVCHFLLELQVLPEPSSVPALKQLSSSSSRQSQKVYDAVTDPLKAPYVHEAHAYSGLTAATAIKKSGAGSLTPGVTGARLSKQGFQTRRSASVGGDSARSSSSATFDVVTPFSYTAEDPRSNGGSTTLRPPAAFIPRTTPFTSIMDPSVFPYIRNGTLLCDIAAKLCGGGGGVDLVALISYLTTGAVDKRNADHSFLFEESRLTTITKSGGGFRRSASAHQEHDQHSNALGTIKHELTNARLSLSSFTRNPRIPSACITNIALAQRLLTALTKASVAKRAGIIGYLPLGVGLDPTAGSNANTSLLHSQQLNGSVAGGNSSLMMSSDLPPSNVSPQSVPPLLAPHCLSDPKPIYNGDVGFILGLLEDLMRYAHGVAGRKALRPGQSTSAQEPYIPPHYSARKVVELGDFSSIIAPALNIHSLSPSIYKPSINNTANFSMQSGVFPVYHNKLTEGSSATASAVSSPFRPQAASINRPSKLVQASANSSPPRVPKAVAVGSNASSQIFSTQPAGGAVPLSRNSTPVRSEVVTHVKQSQQLHSSNTTSAAQGPPPPHQAPSQPSQPPQQPQGAGGAMVDTVANPHMSYLASISQPTDQECGELGRWLIRKLGPKYKHSAFDESFEVDFTTIAEGGGGGPDPFRSVLLNPLWFSGGTCHTGALLSNNSNSNQSSASNPLSAAGGSSQPPVLNKRGMGRCWLLSDGIVLSDLARALTSHNSSKFTNLRVDPKAVAIAAKRNNVRKVVEFLSADGKLGAGKNGIRVGGSSEQADDWEDSAVGGGQEGHNLRLLRTHPHSIVSALSIEEAIVAGDLRAVVMVLRELRAGYRGHIDRKASSSSMGSATSVQQSGAASYSYTKTTTTTTMRAATNASSVDYFSRSSSFGGGQQQRLNASVGGPPLAPTGLDRNPPHPSPATHLPYYEVRGPTYPSNISTPMRNWF